MSTGQASSTGNASHEYRTIACPHLREQDIPALEDTDLLRAGKLKKAQVCLCRPDSDANFLTKTSWKDPWFMHLS